MLGCCEESLLLELLLSVGQQRLDVDVPPDPSDPVSSETEPLEQRRAARCSYHGRLFLLLSVIAEGLKPPLSNRRKICL